MLLFIYDTTLKALTTGFFLTVAAWLSSNGVALINEVTLRRAQLVLGWVTVSGFSYRCGTFISM